MNFEIAPKETEVSLSWEEALVYCQFLNYDGGGWRLPNRDELNWMWTNRTDDMEYETTRFCWYWSSTKFNDFDGWFLSFLNGYQFHLDNNINIFVRAIRDKS